MELRVSEAPLRDRSLVPNRQHDRQAEPPAHDIMVEMQGSSDCCRAWARGTSLRRESLELLCLQLLTLSVAVENG
jgi:hypothetical protein